MIVPTHGRADGLRVCLRHLAALAYPLDRFEVIVVDDGSPEPVEEDIAPIGGELAVTVARQERSGPARARNVGADLAQGRYLAFTDDDCRPTPGWLAGFAAQFVETPAAALGGATVNALPENICSTASQLLCDYLYAYHNADPEHARFFTSSNLALPADVFHDVGGFDTSFTLPAAEDRDLCDRLLRRNLRLVYVPAAVAYHAHPLTLAAFLGQHFRYGRGAFRFRSLGRAMGLDRDRLEPPIFYAELVGFPFGRAPAGRATALAGLLALSQVANVAGFSRELLAER